MIAIREMTASDLPAVWKIVKESQVLDLHTPYSYWAQLNACPALMFVAEHEKQIVGFVSGLGHFRNTKEAFVWQIGVCKEFQNQGIGYTLLERFSTMAKAAGFTSLSLTITEDNPTSHDLFTRFAAGIDSKMINVGTTGTLDGSMKNEIIYEIKIDQ